MSASGDSQRELFEVQGRRRPQAPLAERIRPRSLDEFVGQETLLRAGSPLREDKKASLFDFVHNKLLLHLKSLKDKPRATARQKVISEIMSGVDRSRIDSEKNFADVLDKVDEISHHAVDDTHVFTLSQVYEDLLLKMGEKNSDGGQFFTPREVIRAMVRVVDPQPGETVYDPGCGTGGFLAQSYELMARKLGEDQLLAGRGW